MTGETAGSSASVAGRWELPSIKILNPTLLRTENYAVWRLEAVIHLDNVDVWEMVSGSEPKPTTDPHDNWKRKNRQARSLLIALVSGEYKNLIGNHEHASAAWVTPLPPTYPPEQSDLWSPKYGGIRASRAIRDLSMVVSDALEERSMGGIECSE